MPEMNRANIVPISCQYRCQYIPHTPYRYWQGKIPSGRHTAPEAPPCGGSRVPPASACKFPHRLQSVAIQIAG
jgi:hypothetical protein